MVLSPLGFDTLAAITLLATALLGAYAPVWLERRGRKLGQGRSLAYVLGNMLSAGVMISAGFVHLLGEATAELSGVSKFPIAPFLCAVGYIITLLADNFAEGMTGGHGCHAHDHGTALAAIAVEMDTGLDVERPHASDPGSQRRAKGPANDAAHAVTPQHSGQHSPRRHPAEKSNGLLNGAIRATQKLRTAADGVSPRFLGKDKRKERRSEAGGPHSNGSAPALEDLGDSEDDPLDLPSSSSLDADLDALERGRSSDRVSPGRHLTHRMAPATSESLGQQLEGAERHHLLEHDWPDSAAGASGLHQEGPALKDGSRSGGPNGNGQMPGLAALHEPQVSFVTAVLMAVALCVHSLLEGAALGAQVSIAQSLHIFVAILAHKGLAAYALGSSIVDSKANSRKYWTVIAVFALATPVGIYIGYILHSVTNNDTASGISALASGTFLYVAMMEVIPKELEQPDHRRLKLAMLLLGFALMSLLAVWA